MSPRGLAWLIFITGCMQHPDVEIHNGETVTLSDVNGDVGCDGGTAYLPPNTTINGWLDATNCVLKIMGTINGSLTAHGGIVHVIDVPTVNGELDVTGAVEVIASNSDFNGSAEVDHTA